MSHDVEFFCQEQDVTLSFTAPGRLVYLFAYKAGTDKRELPVFSREDWDKLTKVVHEMLPLGVIE